MVTANATMTNLIQTLSPGEFRGRVMSIFITSSLGLLPFGSLCLGTLSEGIGVQRSVAMFALFNVLATWCVMRYLPKLTQMESGLVHSRRTRERRSVYRGLRRSSAGK